MLTFVSQSKAAMLAVLCKELIEKFTAKANLPRLKLEETTAKNWQWRLYKDDVFVDYDVVLHTTAYGKEEMEAVGFALATKTKSSFRVMMCSVGNSTVQLPCLVAEDTRGSFSLSEVIAAREAAKTTS